MLLSKYLSFLATKKFIKVVTLSSKENEYEMYRVSKKKSAQTFLSLEAIY